jgi:hypothetical protein
MCILIGSITVQSPNAQNRRTIASNDQPARQGEHFGWRRPHLIAQARQVQPGFGDRRQCLWGGKTHPTSTLITVYRISCAKSANYFAFVHARILWLFRDQTLVCGISTKNSNILTAFDASPRECVPAMFLRLHPRRDSSAKSMPCEAQTSQPSRCKHSERLDSNEKKKDLRWKKALR